MKNIFWGSDEYEKAIKIFFFIDRLHHRCIDKRIQEMGLHRNQHFMLMHIADAAEPGFQKQIAEKFQISTAAVTNTLKSLEKNGYITREIDSGDTRRNIINITPKGRRIIDESRATVIKVNQSMFKGFSKERLDAFCDSLEIIKNNLVQLEENEIGLPYDQAPMKG